MKRNDRLNAGKTRITIKSSRRTTNETSIKQYQQQLFDTLFELVIGLLSKQQITVTGTNTNINTNINTHTRWSACVNNIHSSLWHHKNYSWYIQYTICIYMRALCAKKTAVGVRFVLLGIWVCYRVFLCMGTARFNYIFIVSILKASVSCFGRILFIFLSTCFSLSLF